MKPPLTLIRTQLCGFRSVLRGMCWSVKRSGLTASEESRSRTFSAMPFDSWRSFRARRTLSKSLSKMTAGSLRYRWNTSSAAAAPPASMLARCWRMKLRGRGVHEVQRCSTILRASLHAIRVHIRIPTTWYSTMVPVKYCASRGVRHAVGSLSMHDTPAAHAAVAGNNNASSFQHWRALAGADRRAPCGDGAFVALISGDQYMAGALCLHSSMRAVGSSCPLVLVHDDRPESSLSTPSLARLRSVYGRENLVALTDLYSQMPGLRAEARHNYSYRSHFSFERRATLLTPTPINRRLYNQQADLAAFQSRQPAAPLPPGRRLYTSSRGLFATHQKLWFFALPYARVVTLDIDMAVVENVDFLMDYPFNGTVAAVQGCSGTFNSGLMIFRPSISELRRLLELVRHVMHLPRVCETHPGDQSILNRAYRGRWHRLPITLVTKWKGKTNTTWRNVDPALLHFSSEPKPWKQNAPSESQAVWRQFSCQLQTEVEMQLGLPHITY